MQPERWQPSLSQKGGSQVGDISCVFCRYRLPHSTQIDRGSASGSDAVLLGTASFFAGGSFRPAAVPDLGLSRMIFPLLFPEAVSRVLAARAYQRRDRFGDGCGNLDIPERGQNRIGQFGHAPFHERFGKARLFRQLLSKFFGMTFSDEYSPPIFIAMSRLSSG